MITKTTSLNRIALVQNRSADAAVGVGTEAGRSKAINALAAEGKAKSHKGIHSVWFIRANVILV